MESICTAETAEDAEIALLRPSAISAVSAVPPAFGPRILRKKMPGIFMGRSRVSSLSRSMTPSRRTSHHSQRADRACDSGRRVSAPSGVSCEESACALVRAWLTSDTRQRENFLEKSSRRRSKCQRTVKKNATNGTFKRARIGSEKFSCPQFSCLNSEVRQKDCGQKNFQSRKSLGFHPGGEREILQTAEPVATAQRGGWARDSGRGFYVPSCRAI
jgi:hypothetical protein